ncbi:cell division protein FtsQ/DivIB [Brevibacillus fulvus]|uniref:Cell division protein DivIB n=1 Tax=Brevibacillus fulvus TaxID=1125967 RepID=A0A939BTB8_9BACL|nr:FtsQ-type POTRA domain-containing protein [Brevibacillus fulvus]MBM7589324.1 cell division protein FtsQ [Brevibacillus fulvus]
MAVYQERIPHVKQQLPKKRSNRKLLFILLLFFLAILVVIFIRSPYSKVSEIQVYGNDTYTKEEIVKASGLNVGMQFLNVWESQVRENLKSLKGISAVSLVRQFPGIIQLRVEEFDRVAYTTTSQGQRYPLLQNGEVLKQVDFSKRMLDRPLILQWNSPELLPQLAKALANISPAILGEISDISLTPTAYDKQRIILHMRDGNEVRSVLYKLDQMIVWYPGIVKQIPEGEKGIVSLFERPWFVKYGTPEQTAADTDSGQSPDSAADETSETSGQISAEGGTQAEEQPNEDQEAESERQDQTDQSTEINFE